MSDLQHKPTLFIDRNSGGRLFKALIVASGIHVVLHDEVFSITTDDDVWLDQISKKGWIMVTGDKATISDIMFMQKLARRKARVFFLNALNGASPEGKAQCIIDAYPTMLKICRERVPPLFWRFNRGGEVVVVDFRHKLGMLRRRETQQWRQR